MVANALVRVDRCAARRRGHASATAAGGARARDRVGRRRGPARPARGGRRRRGSTGGWRPSPASTRASGGGTRSATLHAHRRRPRSARARSPLAARRQRSSRPRRARGVGPLVRRSTARSLAGFLLGDTRAPARPTSTEQFRAAGLTHLTAVSGGNVAFVLALVAPVLRRLRLGGRLRRVGLAVLVLFGTMTRWEPSVLRAVAMAVDRAARRLPRPTHRRPAGARCSPRPCCCSSTRSCCTRSGSCSRARASLGIALLGAPDRGAAPGPGVVPRGARRSPRPRSSGSRRCSSRCSASMPLVAVPANLVAVPLAAPLTDVGASSPGVVERGHRAGRARRCRICSRSRPSALVRALLAVADVARRACRSWSTPAALAASVAPRVALLAALRTAA